MLSYEEIRIQVHHLTLDEQLQLIEDLAKLIRSQVISHDRHSIIELEALVPRQSTEQPLHNIMEFKGFAKEIWKGVDVEKYIDEERNSWER
ncbi:MAG: hypothetical protein ACJ788_23120 [Ktedonobacteraceae bacterium]